MTGDDVAVKVEPKCRNNLQLPQEQKIYQILKSGIGATGFPQVLFYGESSRNGSLLILRLKYEFETKVYERYQEAFHIEHCFSIERCEWRLRKSVTWPLTHETCWLVTLFLRRHSRLSMEKQCSIRNASINRCSNIIITEFLSSILV